MMSRKVMFYVQHLLGVGHIKRASLIARTMAESGLDVIVILGGPEVQEVDFDGCTRVMLPPVRAADETFQMLVDERGDPIDQAWRDRRVARLLAEYEVIKPDVLLVEQFPFGRRQFRFELMPLLEAARASSAPPSIASSVRDVLVRKADARRNQEMVNIARMWFDRVLIHADQRLIPLEASFPEASTLADKLSYTGYVVNNADIESLAKDRESGRGEVVVSAGGGAVGEPLLRAALAARPLTKLSEHVWRFVTGPNLPNSVFEELAWDAPPGVVYERWRSDFPIVLRNCVLSVSQGGYNTLMDVLKAKARSVIVPFAAGSETEQEFRARALEKLGLVTVVDPATLSPKVLGEAIDKALDTTPMVADIDFSGANTSARIVTALCRNTNVREV
jgi:predicted glycosyltransferase